jgi:hypothetical protein
MALNQWSNRTFVLFAVICAVGGFLVRSSSSQEAERDAGQGEVGRYQMVFSSPSDAIRVLDTKTARFWEYVDDPNGEKMQWRESRGPFDKDLPR